MGQNPCSDGVRRRFTGNSCFGCGKSGIFLSDGGSAGTHRSPVGNSFSGNTYINGGILKLGAIHCPVSPLSKVTRANAVSSTSIGRVR